MPAKGFPARAFVMLLGSCAIAALAALGLVILFFDAVIAAGLVFAVLPIIALAVQGSVAVELVRVGYLRRGRRGNYQGKRGDRTIAGLLAEASSRILGSVLATARGPAVA